jgi:radical SAM/Cys-rich protein
MITNAFEQRIERITGDGLCATGIDTLQVNVGLRCNQQCAHCHLRAGPDRTEMMSWPTMARVVEVAAKTRCGLVDITGGAPELNPHLRRFIEALRGRGTPVQVRTNLSVLMEHGMQSMPEFFREHDVRLVGSMPCYLEENVTAQLGEGAYRKSAEALKALNALGYGRNESLTLDLVFNPAGPLLPPDQQSLEDDYRRELGRRLGVVFSRLITITNMPIGRFRDDLQRRGAEASYMRLLQESFNPETVGELMCRRQVSVGWDGRLYDCDFNLALGMAVDHGAPDHIVHFDSAALEARRIVTGDHCFGCTAGCGSSCGGALV